MSYCPKCGRRIYQEEKGCDFCGIVNDKSLWEGVGGIKSQTSPLDYDFSQRYQEAESKVPVKKKQEKNDSKQWQEPSTHRVDSQEEKPFPTILKVVFIAFVLLVPLIGLLVALLCGFILKASPYESYCHFGKVLHRVLIVIVVAWVVFAFIGFFSFAALPQSVGSFQFSIMP